MQKEVEKKIYLTKNNYLIVRIIENKNRITLGSWYWYMFFSVLIEIY